MEKERKVNGKKERGTRRGQRATGNREENKTKHGETDTKKKRKKQRDTDQGKDGAMTNRRHTRGIMEKDRGAERVQVT